MFFRNVHFELTVNTTFDQYVYVVNSGLVHYIQLPPEFPSIQLWFRYDTFQNKLHRDRPGKSSWHGRNSRDFELSSEATSTVRQKKYILVQRL